MLGHQGSTHCEAEQHNRGSQTAPREGVRHSFVCRGASLGVRHHRSRHLSSGAARGGRQIATTSVATAFLTGHGSHFMGSAFALRPSQHVVVAVSNRSSRHANDARRWQAPCVKAFPAHHEGVLVLGRHFFNSAHVNARVAEGVHDPNVVAVNGDAGVPQHCPCAKRGGDTPCDGRRFSPRRYDTCTYQPHAHGKPAVEMRTVRNGNCVSRSLRSHEGHCVRTVCVDNRECK